MTVTTRSVLIEALVAGTPDLLLGTAENEWLDFKSTPYALDTGKGKYELCKDVAAFANMHGGLLICGVLTRKDPQRAQETAVELRPFPRARADVSRHLDILVEYLRPLVSVRPQWYSHALDTPDGDSYLVLEVEPAPEPSRYVIVRRIPNDKDQLTEGVVVPQRYGDRTVLLGADEIGQLISDGLRSRKTSHPRATSSDDVGQAAAAALNELELLQGWQEMPVLFWQSVPPSSIGLLPGLHNPDGIRGAFTNQNVLRKDGFNFSSRYEPPRTYAGGLLIARPRAGVLLRPDGLLTAGAVATEEMLVWNMGAHGQPHRLSSLVLTELTLEYFRLAELLRPLVPGEWRHRVIARRFAGENPRTLGDDSDTFLGDASPASLDTWESDWPAAGDPERDAYEALARLYALFGRDVSTNPYIQGNRVPTTNFRPSAT